MFFPKIFSGTVRILIRGEAMCLNRWISPGIFGRGEHRTSQEQGERVRVNVLVIIGHPKASLYCQGNRENLPHIHMKTVFPSFCHIGQDSYFKILFGAHILDKIGCALRKTWPFRKGSRVPYWETFPFLGLTWNRKFGKQTTCHACGSGLLWEYSHPKQECSEPSFSLL